MIALNGPIVMSQGCNDNAKVKDLVRGAEYIKFVFGEPLWDPHHVDDCSSNVKDSSKDKWVIVITWQISVVNKGDVDLRNNR